MIVKIFPVIFSIIHIGNCGLLRTPKVYNALITTDENITPSRTYPIIQPHIHETGIAYPAYSFGYGPFGPAAVFESPFAYGQHYPNPTLSGRNNNQRNNQHHFINNGSGEQNEQTSGSGSEISDDGAVTNGGTDQITNDSPQQPDNSLNHNNNENNNNNNQHHNSPIPLNEFGLPPNLIPINPYNYNPNPVNLAPYSYSSYPLVYDQYSGYNQNPYLPPFGYYPQSFAGVGQNGQRQPGSEDGEQQNQNESITISNNKKVKGLSKKSKQSTITNQSQSEESEQSASSGNNNSEALGQLTDRQLQIESNVNDSIKNYPKKNKDIPDVPPPPLPSGAKITTD